MCSKLVDGKVVQVGLEGSFEGGPLDVRFVFEEVVVVMVDRVSVMWEEFEKVFCRW